MVISPRGAPAADDADCALADSSTADSRRNAEPSPGIQDEEEAARDRDGQTSPLYARSFHCSQPTLAKAVAERRSWNAASPFELAPGAAPVPRRVGHRARRFQLLEEQAARYRDLRELSYGCGHGDWPGPLAELSELTQDELDLLYSQVPGHHWNGHHVKDAKDRG